MSRSLDDQHRTVSFAHNLFCSSAEQQIFKKMFAVRAVIKPMLVRVRIRHQRQVVREAPEDKSLPTPRVNRQRTKHCR
jgi:hypothetical protein